MLILIDAQPPHPKPVAALCGPPAPAYKGLTARSTAFSAAHAVRRGLRDMPGAVVVVEEEGPEQLSQQAVARTLLRGRLLLALKKELPVFPATPPMPRWLDPNVTMSGGNVVGQMFPIGWGY